MHTPCCANVDVAQITFSGFPISLLFFLFVVVTKESHLLMFVEAQRIKQSQQRWRATDRWKYLHLCCFASPRKCASAFFQSSEFVFLGLGKCRPRRRTGALHLVAPEGGLA